MALQIARTRERIAHTAFTSELREFTDERPLSHDAVRMFITERHGHTPEDPEVEAAWTLATYEMQESVSSFEMAFSVAMENATIRMAPLLSGLHWRVETVDAPILWTCDRPLMPWRPPCLEDRYRGLGYGNAEEVRMPLSPAMLILRRQASVSPVRVDQRRFHDYNADIAFAVLRVRRVRARAKRTAGQREHHPQPPGRSLPHWSRGPRHRRRDPACRWATSFRSGFHCARSTPSQRPADSRQLRKRLPELTPEVTSAGSDPSRAHCTTNGKQGPSTAR